ncbi:hypothetical protein D3C81_937090 [compost metagenome]
MPELQFPVLDPSIEAIRKKVLQPRVTDDDLVRKIRDAFKVGEEDRLKIAKPIAGPREYEAWLAAILRSLSEARVAATDWAQIIGAQDAVWLQLNDVEAQLQSLVGEELPARLFAQTQLDSQIRHNELVAQHREAHSNRISAILKKNANERERYLLANKVLAFTQYKRDMAPAPSENFARGNDDRFKPFDPEGKVLEGSIEATQYLTHQNLFINESRDADEVASSLEQVSELRNAILAYRQGIEQLSQERRSMEARRVLLETKRDLLVDRLYGKQIDFERRKRIILQRYAVAIESLSARTHGFINAIEAVMGPIVLGGSLVKLKNLAKFDAEDRGAQLDLYELEIRSIEDWLDHKMAVTQRTVRAKKFTLKAVGDGRFVGACEFALSDLPHNAQLTRLRGMRLFAPDQGSPVLARQEIAQASDEPAIADQDAWLSPSPGIADQFWGVKELWNRPVEGKWEVRIETSSPLLGGESVSCILEMLFDYVARSHIGGMAV